MSDQTFLFLISVFGFLAVRFIFRILYAQEISSHKSEFKTLFASFAVQIFVIAVVDFPFWAVVIINFCVLSLLVLSFFIIHKRREKRFLSGFRSFLDGLSLSLMSGLSFRAAFTQNLHSGDPWFDKKMSEVYESVCFKQQIATSYRSSIAAYLSELQEIDNSRVNILSRVRVLKKKFLIEEAFRHRSKQITAQVRAQVLLLAFFYIIIAIASSFYHAFSVMIMWFSISLPLFLAGVVAFLLLVTRVRCRL